MIKGVNHQIIEVRQTNHPYFERALLFIKPSCQNETSAVLEKQGEAFLSKAGSFSALRHARAMCWFKRCALLLAGGLGGVFLGLLLASTG